MSDIKAFDLHRIFLGDEPILFLAEIVLRTAIMYTYTILLLRFLGKRSMGQLSTLELAIIICFGSAVGDPMMGAEVPILHGLVVITTVAFLQIGLEYFINKNKKLEAVMEGRPDCVVDNGRIMCEQLKINSLSHEDLFRFLRGKDVEHLGQINKAYFETSGLMSVIFHAPKNVKPGLSVLPCDNEEEEIYKEGSVSPEQSSFSCIICGATKQYAVNEGFEKCNDCNTLNWSRSVDNADQKEN